jgi:hypothetical protein
MALLDLFARQMALLDLIKPRRAGKLKLSKDFGGGSRTRSGEFWHLSVTSVGRSENATTHCLTKYIVRTPKRR